MVRTVLYPDTVSREPGKIYVTRQLYPGGVPGDYAQHRLVTVCGEDDRASRFFALEEDLTGRQGKVDWVGAQEDGVLCPECFAWLGSRT